MFSTKPMQSATCAAVPFVSIRRCMSRMVYDRGRMITSSRTTIGQLSCAHKLLRARLHVIAIIFHSDRVLPISDFFPCPSGSRRFRSRAETGSVRGRLPRAVEWFLCLDRAKKRLDGTWPLPRRLPLTVANHPTPGMSRCWRRRRQDFFGKQIS